MKKIRFLMYLLFVTVILILFGNNSYAANTMNLNMTDKRPYTEKKYVVTLPNTTENTIFKIIKKDSTQYVYSDALYCLRSGLGFGNSATISSLNADGRLDADVVYTEKYNLKTDATNSIAYYASTIGYRIEDENYNSILWIIDNMYLPEHKDKAEIKANLMKKVLKYDGGINVSEEQLKDLNDDDIEFVQQMALWYFSNYDTNGTTDSLSLKYDTYKLSNATKIDGSSLTEGKQKAIDALYKYFIENAKANQKNYGTGNTRKCTIVKPEVKVDDTKKTVSTSDNFAVFGPFKITKTTGNVDYTLDIKVKDNTGKVINEKDGDTPIVYTVKNASDMSGQYDSIEEAIDKGEFYLKISNRLSTVYDLTDVNIEIQQDYEKIYETTATLWLANAADQQPVVKIEKNEVIEGNFDIVIEKRDEDGNLLFGSDFTLTDDKRSQITITNNGDGTFNCPKFDITSENQEFIFYLEEISSPSGYIKLDGKIAIKIKTKLNEEETKYVVDTVEFINTAGEAITVNNVTFDVSDNNITIKVVNEKVKEFDLALRKFITKVNGVKVDDRTPTINTTNLNKNGVTTAKYTHSKEAVIVKQGDIVTYKIRVYNEGALNAKATKIADYIPEGLGYLMGYNENTDNLWTAEEYTKTIPLVGEKGLYASEDDVNNLKLTDFTSVSSFSDVMIVTGEAKISSTLLEDEIIKAYNSETVKADVDKDDKWQQSTNGTDGLYYQDIEVTCIVLEDNSFKGTLKNIAEIQEFKALDKKGNVITIDDRDSKPNNVDGKNYNPPTDNSSYQEDDDDYEPLELRYFDLALRKFITNVNDEEITTRIPEPKLKTDGTIEYEHSKEPVYVANSDIVTYTIRVYNEGTTLGYVMELSDDIPDGVIFLPQHDTNKEYKWVMYDKDGKKTEKAEEAVEIRTAYLENTLLNPYNSVEKIGEDNPSYAEVKVAFQVIEENITQDDRIIINKAQITKDKAVDEDGNELDIDDEDSIPNKWNEGEDDQDIEKIYVKKFDLALLKWVTQTIVTVDGATTTTDTGFTPTDTPEPVAKVIIDKKKLSKTTVKFVYNIRIENQGEIAGYATEITDYIPDGLEFVATDNPIWTKEGDNKITTRALENTLLQPGETAIVEVVFKWKNGEKNLGLKTNIAEISEDYNDKNSEDVDSDPDNVVVTDYDKQQEDDDDKALVMLELKTGARASYIWLGLVVLTILAGGILLIKKYVI